MIRVSTTTKICRLDQFVNGYPITVVYSNRGIPVAYN